MEQSAKSMEHSDTKIDSHFVEDDDFEEKKKRLNHDRKKRGGLRTMPFILGNFAASFDLVYCFRVFVYCFRVKFDV